MCADPGFPALSLCVPVWVAEGGGNRRRSLSSPHAEQSLGLDCLLLSSNTDLYSVLKGKRRYLSPPLIGALLIRTFHLPPPLFTCVELYALISADRISMLRVGERGVGCSTAKSNRVRFVVTARLERPSIGRRRADPFHPNVRSVLLPMLHPRITCSLYLGRPTRGRTLQRKTYVTSVG